MNAEPNLRRIIAAFLRRKLLFLLVVFIVCAAGWTWLLVQEPLYQSGASLVIRFDNQSMPNIDHATASSLPLGSNERRSIIYSDADILRSADVIRSTIKTLGLPRLYPRIAVSERSEERKLDDAAEQFTTNLAIDVSIQSDVISITYLNSDPVVAHDAVQGLLDRFYAQEATVYANPELRFAQEEADKARDKLTEAQNALAMFKSGSNIPDTQQQVTQLTRQRAAIESQLNGESPRPPEPRQREGSSRRQLKEAPPKELSHESVRTLTAQLNDIDQRIAALGYGRRNQYDDLARAVQIQNDTYRAMALRLETARVSANRNAQKISAAAVIATPWVASRPARPRRKLVALATFLFSLILASGSVLAVEAFDDRLTVPKDVARALRLPVLATFERET